MRNSLNCTALLASLALCLNAVGGGPELYGTPAMGGDDACACETCGCGHRGLFGHHCGHHGRRNAEAGFNCGCNGSYKYPVPPLYTYHWPGMYSAQLMTEYHSPWRFPPLKPYTEEVIETQTSARSLRRVQPAAAVVESRAAGGSSFSQQVERSLR